MDPAGRSPFERLGGEPGISAIVNAFYDLIETDPAYAELRKMHAEDLRPMRVALSGFLAGWTGGPRDWFEANPEKCMMSLHAPLLITQAAAQQWLSAMEAALQVVQVDPKLAGAMQDAFYRMAKGMASAAA